MKKTGTKKISVLVITYNHEKYLAQALDGIFNQKVDAELEVILADDHSTDNTLQIAQNYQRDYSHKIKILMTPQNLGHTRNYARAWALASGDYIAHCDGDDYWTDPNKLSLQLEFLENHPEYSTCAHKVWALSEETGLMEGPIPRTLQESFNTEQMLEVCFPHNCSLLFRRGLIPALPNFFFTLTGHDWCLDILNSLHGPIKILPQAMGVWRMRKAGLWGGRTAEFHLKDNLLLLSQLSEVLPQSFHNALQRSLARHQFLLAEEYLRQANLSQAETALESAIQLRGWFHLPKRKWISVWAQIKLPTVYTRLRNLRNAILGAPHPD